MWVKHGSGSDSRWHARDREGRYWLSCCHRPRREKSRQEQWEPKRKSLGTEHRHWMTSRRPKSPACANAHLWLERLEWYRFEPDLLKIISTPFHDFIFWTSGLSRLRGRVSLLVWGPTETGFVPPSGCFVRRLKKRPKTPTINSEKVELETMTLSP